MSTHRDVFNDFVDFYIDSIVESDTGKAPDSIEFEYNNPAIGIDTGANFVVHEIIGGATVRQRISDSPLEVSVSGVVRAPTAKKIAKLRNAKYGTIYSSQFTSDSLTVHFASVSTSPMEDGGAVHIGDDELLYTFDLECVEILASGN
jgi:hypothetical protein